MDHVALSSSPVGGLQWMLDNVVGIATVFSVGFLFSLIQSTPLNGANCRLHAHTRIVTIAA